MDDREPIYVFNIDETYLFTQPMMHRDIFSEFQEFYNGERYRYEVPDDEFPRVLELLEKSHFKPIPVENVETFTVVKEQSTPDSDILRDSVMQWTRDGYIFFVMESPQAVKTAVELGATRISETEMELER